MAKAREFLARQAASELIDEMGITGAPVPLDEIVKRKRLRFEERPDFPAEVYGAIFRKGNQFGIIVSSNCPTEGHRRFTIAHELGHYHMPDHIERLFPGDAEIALSLGGHYRSKKDPFEVEADCFASELLMPDRLVRALVASLPIGIAAIQTIATEFDTSLSSAAIRYASIADHPSAVILSRDGVVEWAASSQALSSHKWARRSWKGDWAPRGSATKHLGADSLRIAHSESEESSLLLCEWLEGAPEDVETIEEAVGLGAYGRVLTVLTATDLPDVAELEESERDEDEERDWRSALRGYRLG